MNSRERIAYLKGLLDFMPREDKEGKIYAAIVDTLDALVLELEGHTQLIELQREDYEALTNELDDLHEAVYDLEESSEIDGDYDDDDDDDEDDEDEVYDQGDFEEATESYVSVTCPSCAYSFYCRYEEGQSGKRFVCPACGEDFSRPV